MKKVIYCFSGTGNSLNAARIIAKEMGGATIVSVKKGAKSDLAADADVVGFVCPVYEWDCHLCGDPRQMLCDYGRHTSQTRHPASLRQASAVRGQPVHRL